MKQTCLLCFVGVFLLTAGIPVRSEDAVTVATLKEEILKRMGEDQKKSDIRAYIRRTSISDPFELEDILEWKNAGILETYVQTVLEKSERETLTRTFSMSSKFSSLGLTIYPLEFHTAQVKVKPYGSLQNVTVVVRVTNISKKDYLGIVKVTLLDKDEKEVVSGSEARPIEEGNKNKPIRIDFNELTKETVSSIDKVKLDITVERD